MRDMKTQRMKEYIDDKTDKVESELLGKLRV
jgi:hypothetical protein